MPSQALNFCLQLKFEPNRFIFLYHYCKIQIYKSVLELKIIALVPSISLHTGKFKAKYLSHQLL